jgi:hypothetical protein
VGKCEVQKGSNTPKQILTNMELDVLRCPKSLDQGLMNQTMFKLGLFDTIAKVLKRITI